MKIVDHLNHLPAIPFIAGTVVNVEIDMVYQASLSLNRKVTENHHISSETLSKQRLEMQSTIQDRTINIPEMPVELLMRNSISNGNRLIVL